jgi:hypothetical protein
LSEVTSTNSLIRREKGMRRPFGCLLLAHNVIGCHYAHPYPLLQDRTIHHQSSFQTGYFRPTSNSTTGESDSVLSLPKYSDSKSDNRRRISNPDANVLTPLPEPKLLGRRNTSYCWSTHRPNWSRKSKSQWTFCKGPWNKWEICGAFRGLYSEDVAVHRMFVVQQVVSTNGLQMLDTFHSSCLFNKFFTLD